VAEWTVVHLEHDSTEITTFDPENLTFTLNKGEVGPHSAYYEVSRSRGVVFHDFVGPLRTDFQIYRDDDIIMAGPHTMLNIKSNQEMVGIGGKDWLHRLELLKWPFDPTDVNAYVIDDPPPEYAYYVTDEQIANILIQMFDTITNQPGARPFTYTIPGGFTETVPEYAIDVLDSQNMYSRIQELSQLDPGEFDFWIDAANRDFRLAAPRNYDMGVVDDPDLAEHTFDLSVPESGVFDIEFTNTGPQYTLLRGTGEGAPTNVLDAETTTLASVRQYTPAIAVYELIIGDENFGDVTLRERLERLTRKALLFGVNPVHEVTLTVRPEGITNFWTRFKPGIPIWVTAELDAHLVDSAQEIVSMDCGISNQGDELVTFRLNQIYAADTIDT